MAKFVAVCLALFACASAFPILPSMRLKELPENWKEFFGGMPAEWKQFVDQVVAKVPEEWVPIIDKIIATGEATEEEQAAYEKFWAQFPEEWKDHFEAYVEVYFGLDDDEEPAERQAEKKLSPPVAHFFERVETSVGNFIMKYSSELEALQEDVQPKIEQIFDDLAQVKEEVEEWAEGLGPKGEELMKDVAAEFEKLKAIAEKAKPEQVEEVKRYVADYVLSVFDDDKAVAPHNVSAPVLKFLQDTNEAISKIFTKYSVELGQLQEELEPIADDILENAQAVAQDVEDWFAELGPKAKEMEKDIMGEFKALRELAEKATPEQIAEAKAYIIEAIADNLEEDPEDVEKVIDEVVDEE